MTVAPAGRAAFPDFRAHRALYEDDDVIAVDKPSGVPSEAPDPAVRDDLPHRLALFLAARDGLGAPAYVGTHQRLDALTSGVILYAKRREANASLAEQFEGRSVVKEYVAIVEARPWKGERVLRHALVPGDGGRMVVARAGDRRAKDAETRVCVEERSGPRLLLRCTIATGRTHQIRAQLAAEGMSVCGDPLYGGAPAPRLMLHASRLALRHPIRDLDLDIRCPAPRTIGVSLGQGADSPYGDLARLRDLLESACEARWGLARATLGTDCFRLVHEDADGLPGLAVDVYGEHLVAHFSSDEAIAARETILDALDALGFAGIYGKVHPKHASTLTDAQRAELAPSSPVRGTPTPAPDLVVHEHGLPLHVRLGDGLATGLYLDQRETRRRVRELARDRRVLNLFAYTCAFSAASVAGAATEVVSVDASREALARGEENVRAPNVMVAKDVFVFLGELAARRAAFDLVIVDPPTYSTTRDSRWGSGEDWVGLVAQCLAVLAPGGRLLATTNDRRLSHDRFRAHLRAGAREAGVAIEQLKDLPLPRDFRVVPWGPEQQKSVLLLSG